MLNIYQINPESLTVAKTISAADCRGVGEYELVTPCDMTLQEIRDYCQEHWACLEHYEDYQDLTWDEKQNG